MIKNRIILLLAALMAVRLVPAGDIWTVRFASPLPGDYGCKFKCSDAANKQ